MSDSILQKKLQDLADARDRESERADERREWIAGEIFRNLFIGNPIMRAAVQRDQEAARLAKHEQMQRTMIQILEKDRRGMVKADRDVEGDFIKGRRGVRIDKTRIQYQNSDNLHRGATQLIPRPINTGR